MTSIINSNEIMSILFKNLLKRRLSGDDDDDEDGTWNTISTGERVTIVFITIISIILCLYFCYYIKCRKELPSDRIPLTSSHGTSDKRLMA